MSKGFGKAPQRYTACETRVMDTPASNQKFNLYRSKKKMYADFDDLLRIYGVKEEDVPEFKVRNIVPRGKVHPEMQFLRGIEIGAMIKLIGIAIDKGTPEGRLRAIKDQKVLTEEGAKSVGMHGAYITEDGMMVAVDKEGKPINGMSFKLDEDYPMIATVLGNRHPFIIDIHEKVGCEFYQNIAHIGLRRVKKLSSNHEIAHYMESLINGLMARHPELEDCDDYVMGLIYFLTSDFSDDRRQIIVGLIQNGMTPESNHRDILEDLMLALDRVMEEIVVAPGKADRFISKSDMLLLDHVFQGEHRFLEIVQRIEKAEKDKNDK